MKYLAIIDDEFLSNFRVDVNPTYLNMVLVVEDRTGSTRGIELKPIVKEMLVTKEGSSAYLPEKTVNHMLEWEKEQMEKRAIQSLMRDMFSGQGEKE